jgi:hypothetical protein
MHVSMITATTRVQKPAYVVLPATGTLGVAGVDGSD